MEGKGWERCRGRGGKWRGGKRRRLKNGSEGMKAMRHGRGNSGEGKGERAAYCIYEYCQVTILVGFSTLILHN